jgi:hypothetical protein
VKVYDITAWKSKRERPRSSTEWLDGDLGVDVVRQITICITYMTFLGAHVYTAMVRRIRPPRGVHGGS